tara:strand:+ start:8844 stop:9161 length:318 start_codon:yes stop_codon:yes gene_type:complete
MKIFVDIDETIFKTKGMNYEDSKPIQKNIDIVNKLYNDGHEITMWTARGSGSGLDWTEVTTKQLKNFGVKYHSLKFGKPVFDLFIDDKVINTERFFNDYSSFIGK